MADNLQIKICLAILDFSVNHGELRNQKLMALQCVIYKNYPELDLNLCRDVLDWRISSIFSPNYLIRMNFFDFRRGFFIRSALFQKLSDDSAPLYRIKKSSVQVLLLLFG